jgi:hypothetical protein
VQIFFDLAPFIAVFVRFFRLLVHLPELKFGITDGLSYRFDPLAHNSYICPVSTARLAELLFPLLPGQNILP